MMCPMISATALVIIFAMLKVDQITAVLMAMPRSFVAAAKAKAEEAKAEEAELEDAIRPESLATIQSLGCTTAYTAYSFFKSRVL